MTGVDLLALGLIKQHMHLYTCNMGAQAHRHTANIPEHWYILSSLQKGRFIVLWDPSMQ